MIRRLLALSLVAASAAHAHECNDATVARAAQGSSHDVRILKVGNADALVAKLDEPTEAADEIFLARLAHAANLGLVTADYRHLTGQPRDACLAKLRALGASLNPNAPRTALVLMNFLAGTDLPHLAQNDLNDERLRNLGKLFALQILMAGTDRFKLDFPAVFPRLTWRFTGNLVNVRMASGSNAVIAIDNTANEHVLTDDQLFGHYKQVIEALLDEAILEDQPEDYFTGELVENLKAHFNIPGGKRGELRHGLLDEGMFQIGNLSAQTIRTAAQDALAALGNTAHQGLAADANAVNHLVAMAELFHRKHQFAQAVAAMQDHDVVKVMHLASRVRVGHWLTQGQLDSIANFEGGPVTISGSFKRKQRAQNWPQALIDAKQDKDAIKAVITNNNVNQADVMQMMEEVIAAGDASFNDPNARKDFLRIGSKLVRRLSLHCAQGNVCQAL
jgi:hypothetical protein